MAVDKAVRRAASVIIHALRGGATLPEALAKAEEREPTLSESEIGEAYNKAMCGIQFREMCRLAPKDTPIWKLLNAAGVDWRREDGAQ